ncbi:hypothetical protein [Bacillus cabrialesii]|uniref:Replication protein n=1 Tax=Bacillus cabrialesii subsp. tritici TaxID=2944916 RepID=A0ABT9DP40_9BACI|nr:hypothetical protein [Bacillus cabrialesii]MDO8226436.1 hypothetical protein [Bacillus cabrialesii subsp. tritici]
MNKTFMVQVPIEIVRNPKITCEEFVLLSLLLRAYYQNKKRINPFKVNYRVLKDRLNISKNETFKEHMNGLHKNGLINDEITILPRRGILEVQLSDKAITEQNKKEPFVQVTENIINQAVIQEIKPKGVRLFYYYKSYLDIRKTEPFAYPGFERIMSETGLSDNTVRKHNKIMQKNKFIKVINSSKQISNLNYGEDYELITEGFQNKYYLFENKIDNYAHKKNGNLTG